MTEISTSMPIKKLWNPKSFIILSVIFSFLPTGIICSLNYGRLGDNKKKWITLISTILCFITFIGLADLLQVKNSALLLPINVCIGIFFRNIQKKLYDEHIINGGERASYFLPILIGFLLIASIIAIRIYTIDMPENSITYGQNKVYYTNAIKESEARKLGDYFKGDIFTDTSKIDVKIDKEQNTYVFSLIVNDDTINNQEFINSMKDCSKDLSKDIFNNNPVRVDLCNDRFNVLKSIN